MRQDAAESSGARISARADRLSQSRTFRFDPHHSICNRQRLMRATVAAESVARSAPSPDTTASLRVTGAGHDAVLTVQDIALDWTNVGRNGEWRGVRRGHDESESS